jgi:hypothetical protein
MTETSPALAQNEPNSSPKKAPNKRRMVRTKLPRQKPVDNYNQTLYLIGLGLQEFSKNKMPVILSNIGLLRTYLRNFCLNNGIRGKQRKSMERILSAQISILRAELIKKAKIQ